MKKLLAMLSLSVLAVSCYDEYVKDYDYSAVSVAYQYDLRTLVVGEGMKFDFGTMLSGVISNDRDRVVRYSVDNSLIDAKAFDIMTGVSTEGSVSQPYVTTAMTSAGITRLTPVPESFYTLSSPGEMTIAKGRHTATVTFQADSAAMLADAFVKPTPYYAFAFRIDGADADQVLEKKNFEVIALRIENRFFGNWYHGGRTVVRKDLTAEIVSDQRYSGAVPQPDTRIYTLTSTGPFSVRSNRLGNASGTLDFTFDGDRITLSAPGREIEPWGDGSFFNGAKLLQDRKLFLSYKYSNGNGTTTYISDTLSFRNRIRDGVNEWQDPDPSHYNN